MFMLGNDAGEKDRRTKYRAYLEANKAAFPGKAFELARSEWYWDWHDHRCPHDAWLEKLTIEEVDGAVVICTRLLGAWHDGYIELTYSNVQSYKIERLGTGITVGPHGDWRYDEFRLSENGLLLHEIEWATLDDTAHWIIESADVEYSWQPAQDVPHREGIYQLREAPER